MKEKEAPFTHRVSVLPSCQSSTSPPSLSGIQGPSAPNPPQHLFDLCYPLTTQMAPSHEREPFPLALHTPYVSLDAALAIKLVPHEVGIVRGVDVVMVQGLSHILVNREAGWVEDISIFRAEVVEETVHAQHVSQFA